MGDMRTIEVYEIADTVNEMVDIWTAAVVAGIDTAQVQTINKAKKYIKPETPTYNVSPQTPAYIDCYVMKTRSKQHSRALWNKKYSLSHLIEDGHEVHNQYGGPYTIKNRVEDTSEKQNRDIADNMTTSQYDMWDDTFDDFDVLKVYVEFIKQNLEKIRTK